MTAIKSSTIETAIRALTERSLRVSSRLSIVRAAIDGICDARLTEKERSRLLKEEKKLAVYKDDLTEAVSDMMQLRNQNR